MALNIFSVHVALSLVTGIVDLIYFWGIAMGDSYGSDPAWITALDGVIWILQPPVRALGSVTSHWNQGVSPLVVIVLAVLWSLLFGYLVAWFIQMFRNVK